VIVGEIQQGQHQALTGALAMHHVGHAHARVEFGMPVDPAGLDVIRNDSKATLAEERWGGLMAGTTWPGDPNSSAEPRRRERSRRGIDSESTSSS